MGVTVTININNICRVKLNSRGVDAYNRHYASIGLLPPKKLRPNDVYEDQLWCIMHIFGDACYMGPEPAFKTIIEIDTE